MNKFLHIQEISEVEYARKYDLIYIEDSYNEVLLFESVLAKLSEDFQCAWINNAELAIELLEANKFPEAKLILLDIRMPILTGMECLEIIRDKYKHLKTPIVLLSSSDHPKDIKKAYDLKCNGYLVKSDDIIDFRNMIKTTMIYWTQLNQIC